MKRNRSLDGARITVHRERSSVCVMREHTPHPQGVCAITYDARRKCMLVIFAPGHPGATEAEIRTWRMITWVHPESLMPHRRLQWNITTRGRRIRFVMNQRAVRPGVIMRCVHVCVPVELGNEFTRLWAFGNASFTCTQWHDNPNLLLGFSILSE